MRYYGKCSILFSFLVWKTYAIFILFLKMHCHVDFQIIFYTCLYMQDSLLSWAWSDNADVVHASFWLYMLPYVVGYKSDLVCMHGWWNRLPLRSTWVYISSNQEHIFFISNGKFPVLMRLIISKGRSLPQTMANNLVFFVVLGICCLRPGIYIHRSKFL